MDWLQLSVEVSGDQVERTVAAFEVIGAQATTQQNAGEDSYFDLAHPAEPKWDVQCVTGLFEAQGKDDEILSALMHEASFIKEAELTQLPDQNWETAWLDQYQPIEITEDLWIYPGWVTPDASIKTVIKIDPGMAFGTGSHETTRLCMQALSQLNLNQQHVLDYGCGSGILAITALKLGAADAVGVDIDPKAELVSLENAQNNGVESRFIIQSAEALEAQKEPKFELVIANILAFALIDLAPCLMRYVEDDGMILLSGILSHQAPDVIEAYQDQFDFKQADSMLAQGDWVALLARKRA
ncbi:MAG: 50S ribosomal protein L11 methyltransferase [Arenicellales bacterium]